MRVASAQLNFRYGDQIHYPYSIGTLLAYASTQRDDLEILPCAVTRERMDDHIALAATADVLLMSTYVWNWEASVRLAQEAKARHPGLLVVMGGPQVPDRPAGFFDHYPFADVLVHSEGEQTLVRVLSGARSGPGITTRSAAGEPPDRIFNLDALPSPYTSGMIDALTRSEANTQWVATWETNRGCPYSCTFCDWGSLTYAKVRQYPDKRLFGEIEWFARRGTRYIDCADANFAMFPRDLELARRLRAAAATYGAPQTFRQSWAKNSSEKVIEVASELQQAGMLTAVGLALQSLDTETLHVIKRKNLPFARFSDLTRKFEAAGLPTYTEIIRGLPGETLESFKRGVATVASDSRIGTIYIYNNSLLPNAPQADLGYRQTHKIETVRSPIYLAHSSADAQDIQEYEDIVVATATMPHHDMLQAYMFSWAVLLGESLWLLKHVRTSFGSHGVNPQAFYDMFLGVCQDDRRLFGDEYRTALAYATRGYRGLGWDHVDHRFGDIKWPLEEASWLRLATSPGLSGQMEKICTAIAMQAGIESGSWVGAAVQHQVDLLTTRPTGVPLADWARETVWYGRRRGRFRQGEGV